MVCGGRNRIASQHARELPEIQDGAVLARVCMDQHIGPAAKVRVNNPRQEFRWDFAGLHLPACPVIALRKRPATETATTTPTAACTMFHGTSVRAAATAVAGVGAIPSTRAKTTSARK